MIPRIAIVSCCVITAGLFCVAALYFYQFFNGNGDRHLLNLIAEYVLMGFWPAFLSLLIAVRFRRSLGNLFIALAITPTIILLLLSVGVYIQQWL